MDLSKVILDKLNMSSSKRNIIIVEDISTDVETKLLIKLVKTIVSIKVNDNFRKSL